MWAFSSRATSKAAICPWRAKASAATHSVFGGHTYATAGNYTAKVTIDDGLGQTAEADTPVVVSATSLVAKSPATATVNAGLPAFSGAPLATGHGPRGHEAGSTRSELHRMTIDWGDGSATEAGTIRPNYAILAHDFNNMPGFSVTGEHTYATAGDYTLTVTIAEKNGPTVTTTTAVHAQAETLTLAPATIAATEGSDTRTIVATGTDSAPLQARAPQGHHRLGRRLAHDHRSDPAGDRRQRHHRPSRPRPSRRPRLVRHRRVAHLRRAGDVHGPRGPS